MTIEEFKTSFEIRLNKENCDGKAWGINALECIG
jgi:hypothetical protein